MIRLDKGFILEFLTGCPDSGWRPQQPKYCGDSSRDRDSGQHVNNDNSYHKDVRLYFLSQVGCLYDFLPSNCLVCMHPKLSWVNYLFTCCEQLTFFVILSIYTSWKQYFIILHQLSSCWLEEIFVHSLSLLGGLWVYIFPFKAHWNCLFCFVLLPQTFI